MKKTIRLMGLCLLLVACIVFAACGNREVQEGHTLFVTHFGNGELESSSYTVSTMSVDVASEEGNTVTVVAGGLTYVHTFDKDTLKVKLTVCSDANGEVYTATYEGDKCTAVYADGKTVTATYADGELASVSDGTYTIEYEYALAGGRTDRVKNSEGAVILTHTVNNNMRRTKTVAGDYTIIYTYTDDANWTEKMTFTSQSLEIVTEYVNGKKATVTQGDIVSSYDENGDLISRTQNGTDLLALFEVVNEGGGYKITGYNGTETSVEVPASINLTPVVEIADGALANVTVTSIPTSVRKIGANAVGTAGLTAENGVYVVSGWAVAAEAGVDEYVLPTGLTGVAGSVFGENAAITYKGTLNKWMKVLKGTNWAGEGYILNLNPGKVADGFVANGEYSWTSGKLIFKNRNEEALSTGVERLWTVKTPSGIGAAYEHEVELSLRSDEEKIYLAIEEIVGFNTNISIDLNPDLNASTQFTINVTSSGRPEGGMTITAQKHTTDGETVTTEDISGLVTASGLDGYDNGQTYIKVFEFAIDRSVLGATNDTLGLRATFKSENTEIVYGDEKSVKSAPIANGNLEIGYHVLSLENNKVDLGLTSGWLLAEYGYKQATVDLGEALARTEAPVVDGKMGKSEYTVVENLYNNGTLNDKFFYIDENFVPESDKTLALGLAYDKNYVYLGVTAFGVHDTDNFGFRIGNGEETGKGWVITVTRKTADAEAKEDVNYNTITLREFEQTIDDARNHEYQSGNHNSTTIVAGREMVVDADAGTIVLELALDRAALERDVNNPDLDKLYLHVTRSMYGDRKVTDAEGNESVVKSDLGEIHFGFRVEEGDPAFNAEENFGYDNVIHNYHQAIFNRFPHVITFDTLGTPAVQEGNGSFQIGYGIENITPWLSDMGIANNQNLLDMLDAQESRTVKEYDEDGNVTASRYMPAKNGDGSLSLTLAGYMGSDTRFSTRVADEIFATCIAFKDGDGDVALLVSLDILHFTVEEPIALYDNVLRVLRPLGFEEGDVIISATHTHTGPNVFGGDYTNRFAYTPYFYEQIANAAAEAVADLKPVESISADYYTTSEQLSFERRGYDADDKTFWANSVKSPAGYPNGSTSIFESSHNFVGTNGKTIGRDGKTADSDIQMVLINRVGAQKPIVIANWSAHPDNVRKDDSFAAYDQPLSGDFVHYMRAGVSANYDFIFFQGASGNTINNSRIDKANGDLYRQQHVNYGNKLASELLTGISQLTDANKIDVSELSIAKNHNQFSVYYQLSHVGMPENIAYYIELVNQFYDGEITMAEGEAKITEYNKKFGLSVSSMYECASLKARYSTSNDSSNEFDFAAITMGDVTFASAPYEMFWQTGWDIRNDEFTKDKTVLILTHANGTYGYIPTQEIIESREGMPGGYEVAVCNYEKGSAERIADHIIEMIEKNYGVK